MKVILSRKGFDSGYGGYASPILPDGRLISLPIPDETDEIPYSRLSIDADLSYLDLMNSLKPNFIKENGIRGNLDNNTTCHLDPDIYKVSVTTHLRMETETACHCRLLLCNIFQLISIK